jgi:thiamine kinase-like enzyme
MDNAHMALTLEQALTRVPQWAGAIGLKTSPLGGGITNLNYRVDVGGESFVLRIAGADTELLGIDRQNEYAANQMAGRLGIAPEVVYFIRPEGYLVTRFVAGQPIPPEAMRLPETIRRVMEAVRRIHAMPEIPGTFSVFRTIEAYTAAARRYNVSFPREFDWLTARVQEAEQALARHPAPPCPCHNDLLNANFLTDGRLWILDWEYAGMGDRFFDLANFSDHHELTDEQDRFLLECYFGEAVAAQWAHLKIMKMLSDLREAAWGLVQIGISKLDFDFRAYADKFYGRAFAQIHDPHWVEWLKEVT